MKQSDCISGDENRALNDRKAFLENYIAVIKNIQNNLQKVKKVVNTIGENFESELTQEELTEIRKVIYSLLEDKGNLTENELEEVNSSKDKVEKALQIKIGNGEAQ